MNKVKMTEQLLHLICYLQSAKKFATDKRLFQQSIGVPKEEQVDWYKSAKDLFVSFDKDTISKCGINQNLATFEKIMRFKVTDEMGNREYSELDKFDF